MLPSKTQIMAGPVRGYGFLGARSEVLSGRGGGRKIQTCAADVCLFTSTNWL